MPNIDSIDGIKINIYNGDHVPPHIHAIYNEYEALLDIETKTIYAGYLPARQLRKVVAWLAENEQEALEIFYELNSNLR
jgi:hypothetical protein